MKTKLALVVIIIIGFFFRFYMLGSVPAGLTSDEADTGYDAYSILINGRDQWGKFLPITSFKGFGDNRSPLYTYLVVPSVALFDLSAFAVRLPSALAGVFSVLFIFFLAKIMFDEVIGIISSLFLAISPWSIGLSRQGIESNVGILLVIAGLYFILRGLNEKKYLFISAILFIASIYTYTSYLVIAPLLLASIFFINRKKFLKKKKQVAIFAVLFLIGIVPLFFLTSASSRFSQVGIGHDVTSQGLIEVLNQKIGTCQQQIPNVLCRVLDNKILLFTSTFFQNYLHHFSFDFLFLKGTTTQYSLLPERGLLYLYEALLLIAGLYFLVRKKSFLAIVLLLCSVVPDAMSGGGHHSRASAMVPFLVIISSVGLVGLLKSFRYTKMKKYVGIGVACCIFFAVISFFVTYLTYFKNNYSSYSQYVYRDLSKDLAKQKSNYSKIYVSNYRNDTQQYIFYLFYNKIDPRKVQSRQGIVLTNEDGGFITVRKIDNIYFDNFIANPKIPEKYLNDKESLFIAHPDAFQKDVTVKKEYKDLSGGTNFEAVEYNQL